MIADVTAYLISQDAIALDAMKVEQDSTREARALAMVDMVKGLGGRMAIEMLQTAAENGVIPELSDSSASVVGGLAGIRRPTYEDQEEQALMEAKENEDWHNHMDAQELASMKAKLALFTVIARAQAPVPKAVWVEKLTASGRKPGTADAARAALVSEGLIDGRNGTYQLTRKGKIRWIMHRAETYGGLSQADAGELAKLGYGPEDDEA